MEYTYNTTDDLAIFDLSGNLIGENDGMPLSDDFNECIEEQGVKNFILNLEKLAHINSSGLGVFITLLTRVRKKDGELVLVNPSDNIKRLMVITKLNSIFKIYDTIGEATDALKG